MNNLLTEGPPIPTTWKSTKKGTSAVNNTFPKVMIACCVWLLRVFDKERMESVLTPNFPESAIY